MLLRDPDGNLLEIFNAGDLLTTTARPVGAYGRALEATPHEAWGSWSRLSCHRSSATCPRSKRATMVPRCLSVEYLLELQRERLALREHPCSQFNQVERGSRL